MMNKFLLLLSIFLTVSMTVLYGQNVPSTKNIADMFVTDSGYIKISYALNATDIKDYNTYDDWQILEIGTSISKYYSFIIYNRDSLITEWKKKNPRAQGIPRWLGIQGKDKFYWSDYYYSEYFKDFTKNTLTEYGRMPAILEKLNAYYDEELPFFDWKISTDTLTILSYLCQKATCSFRGRDFISWFTTDIPISNGPWKFGGLPGLILKISDTEKKFDFECIGIEYSLRKFPIKKYNDYNTKYEKKERKAIWEFQQKIKKDYRNVAGLVPAWTDKYPPQKTTERIRESIELE